MTFNWIDAVIAVALAISFLLLGMLYVKVVKLEAKTKKMDTSQGKIVDTLYTQTMKQK